jgi:Disulfide bond chaperones of the HSP33 family
MKASNPDQIHRFVFDDCDIRGEIVTLDATLHDATAHQHLPEAARALLGEFLTAVSLMIEVLKFSGTLTLQARGAGPVPLIMAEATDARTLRGIVKFAEGAQPDLSGLTLPELIGNGVLTLTLDPTQGQRYQGIVALEGDTLAQCLTAYFARSEQLPTRLWLYCDGRHAGGLLLQALPPSAERTPRPDAWETAEHLAETITAQELFELDHATVLVRLFNEFEVRLFPPQELSFKCQCSRERSLQALTSLGRNDAYALLSERDVIDINCEFCGAQYRFGQQDLDELFSSSGRQLH